LSGNERVEEVRKHMAVGLTLMELESQAGGLLPERVEMKKVSKIVSTLGNVTNVGGTGGAGGQCVGIASSVSCAGGNGGTGIMKA
jgi:hypothetical protein